MENLETSWCPVFAKKNKMAVVMVFIIFDDPSDPHSPCYINDPCVPKWPGQLSCTKWPSDPSVSSETSTVWEPSNLSISIFFLLYWYEEI